MNKRTPKMKAADAAYQAQPEQKKKRAMRNAARREAIRQGIVKKGDGVDIDHKQMLDTGGTNAKSNLRAVPKSENRAWRKSNPKAYGK